MMKIFIVIGLAFVTWLLCAACTKENSAQEFIEPCGYVTAADSAGVVVNGIRVDINNTATAAQVYTVGAWFCR